MRGSSSWRHAAGEALSWLIPVACAGCGEPDVALCDRCDSWLRSAPARYRQVGDLPVVSALEYDGPLVGILRAFKTEGRTSLARPLGVALHRALRAGGDLWPSSVWSDETIPAVPIPTSPAAYRRRGFRTVELIARAGGIACIRMLRAEAHAVDQRILGRDERARNATGMFRLARAAPPFARPLVLIDDVVTTGATLAAAADVMRGAGHEVIGAATVASTPLRAPLPEHGK